MRTDFDLNKHKTRIKKCSCSSEYGYKIKNQNNVEIKLLPYRCHSYFCEHCAKIKRIRLRKKIESVFKKGRWRFLTLTLDRKLYSNEEGLIRMNYMFNLFWKRFKDNKMRFSYFKIHEFTKKGMIHYHILINRYLDKELVQKYWKDISGSTIEKIKDIPSKAILGLYLSKYLSKTLNELHNEYFYLFQKRRYSYSQQLELPPDYDTGFKRTYILHNPYIDKSELIILFLLYTFGFQYQGVFKFVDKFT